MVLRCVVLCRKKIVEILLPTNSAEGAQRVMTGGMLVDGCLCIYRLDIQLKVESSSTQSQANLKTQSNQLTKEKYERKRRR